MSKLRALEIALELKGAGYKYVSFSSRTLDTPNKKECVFIPFEKEELVIDMSSFFHAKVIARNIDLSMQDEIEKKNCLALRKQELGRAIAMALS